MMYNLLKDRVQAGQMLAEYPRVQQLAAEGPVIVLGLPRGGVPVAYQIAKAFNSTLDVMIVRKLGVPYMPEVAMGAISLGNIKVFNQDLLRQIRISEEEMNQVVRQETAELERRNLKYRGGRPFPSVQNKIVMIVDDGIATGATLKAAILAVKKMEPKKVIAIAPVGPPDSVHDIEKLCEVICPHQPDPFNAVGLWYEHFPQTEDAEVIQLLDSSKSFGKEE